MQAITGLEMLEKAADARRALFAAIGDIGETGGDGRMLMKRESLSFDIHQDQPLNALNIPLDK